MSSTFALFSLGYLLFAGIALEKGSLTADRVTTAVLAVSVLVALVVGGLAWLFCVVAAVAWVMASSFKF